MLHELKLSDKLLKETGYKTVFCHAENRELLLFYKSSIEETTIFGLSYSTDSLKKYIGIGCLSQSTNDIEFGCYSGVDKNCFNKEDLFERIKIIEDEIVEYSFTDLYDESMRDKLKFVDVENVIQTYCEQTGYRKNLNNSD